MKSERDKVASIVNSTIRELEKQAKIDPDNDAYRYELGMVYVANGHISKARTTFDRLLRDFPLECATHYAWAGTVYWMQEDAASAVEIWKAGCHCQFGGAWVANLLYFASIRKPDAFVLEEALRLIQRFGSDGLTNDWMQWIGRFLRNKVKVTQLRRALKNEPECIRLAAEFHIGVKQLQAGNGNEFHSQMLLCSGSTDQEATQVTEFHLARYEAGLLPKKKSVKRSTQRKPRLKASGPDEELFLQSKSYGNVTLHGVEQKPVVAWLKANAHRAIVSPMTNGCLVVYHEDDGSDYPVAVRLSQEFACAALVGQVHDDDIFCYDLFQSGRKLDTYNSSPDYFTDVSAKDWAKLTKDRLNNKKRNRVPPKGGKPEKLLKAFSSSASAEEVERVLRGEYAFARERHQALAKVLSLPDFSAAVSYREVNAVRPLPAGFVRIAGKSSRGESDRLAAIFS